MKHINQLNGSLGCFCLLKLPNITHLTLQCTACGSAVLSMSALLLNSVSVTRPAF